MPVNIVRSLRYADVKAKTDHMAGLYIHIPFCRSKCAYCDFFSTPDSRWMNRYIPALLSEFSMREKEVSEHFSTLYLGGGTPSMLPDGLLARLLEGIDRLVGIESMSEITIEANPEDITPLKLDFYKSIGINRISIGIQSFDERELEAVSRRHSAAESIRALETMSASGINFNADLIYGLPGQTLDGWKLNLDRLLSYAPPHFSAYLLSYEPGTRMYVRLANGDVAEAPETLVRQMYGYLCDKAVALGYEHYEISNFALPDKKAVHNSLYWHYVPYVGLGAAAHSFDGAVRRFNPNNIIKYLDLIESGRLAYDTDEESEINRFNDYVITSLRTNDGFDTGLAQRLFSAELTECFRKNAAALPENVLTLTPEGNYVIPEKNWLTADSVLRELILV